MSCGVLGALAKNKALLFLSLLVTVGMLRPMAQGAITLTEPQHSAQGLIIDRDDFLIPGDTARFANERELFGVNGQIGLANSLQESPTLTHDDVPATISGLTAVGDRHWFAFERHWFSLESSAWNELSEGVRTLPKVSHQNDPPAKSSPIPSPLAAQSGLALGVVVGIWVLSRRGQRAFR